MRVSIGCDPICRTVGRGVPGARLDRRRKCARPCAAGQPGPRRMVWAFCDQSWSACPCRLDHSPCPNSATATVASPNPKTESAASLRMGVCKHVVARSCWGNTGRGGEFPSDRARARRFRVPASRLVPRRAHPDVGVRRQIHIPLPFLEALRRGMGESNERLSLAVSGSRGRDVGDIHG